MLTGLILLATATETYEYDKNSLSPSRLIELLESGRSRRCTRLLLSRYYHQSCHTGQEERGTYNTDHMKNGIIQHNTNQAERVSHRRA